MAVRRRTCPPSLRLRYNRRVRVRRSPKTSSATSSNTLFPQQHLKLDRSDPRIQNVSLLQASTASTPEHRRVSARVCRILTPARSPREEIADPLHDSDQLDR